MKSEVREGRALRPVMIAKHGSDHGGQKKGTGFISIGLFFRSFQIGLWLIADSYELKTDFGR